MEGNLTPDLMGKLKEAIFGHGRKTAVPKTAGDADYLVKMNLPPLLGRRDAAVEKFEHEFATGLDEEDIPKRTGHYQCMLRLLDSAIRDTRSVIITLSNADTSMRERRLLQYLELVTDTLNSAALLAGYEKRIFEGDEALKQFLTLDREGKLRRRSNAFADCERRLLANTRELIEMAHPSLKRHRDYTRKNFNSHNAARYHRAFAEFSGVNLQCGHE